MYSLFDQALEKKEELSDLRRERKTTLDNFCLDEHGDRKSPGFKDLKRELKLYAKLMDKVQAAQEKGEGDPISAAFSKVNEIVELLRDMGKMDMLNEYLQLLSSLNVEIKNDKPKVVNPVDELDEKLKANLNAQNRVKEELNGLKEKAEEDGICSKTRFNALVKIVKNRDSEDVEDQIQEEFLLSSLVSKGAEEVSKLIKPKSDS